MQFPAVIRLEVLTSKQIKWILFLTYATMVLCVGLIPIERNSAMVQDIYPNVPCDDKCMDRCYVETPDGIRWRIDSTLKPLELYFSLRIVDVSDQGRTGGIFAGVNVFGYEDTRDTLFGCPSPLSPSKIYSSEFNTTVSCGSGENDACNPVDVLVEDDYMFDQTTIYSHYRVEVDFHATNPANTLEFLYHKEGYRIAAMVIRSILFCVTFLIFYKWARALHEIGYKGILREQLWICVLLFMLLLYQSPAYIAVVTYPVRRSFFAFAYLCVISLSTILTFWLVLVHDLSGVAVDMIKFYRPKLIFQVCFCICFLVTTVYRPADSHSSLFLVFKVATILVFTAWGFFMFRYLLSARRRLKQLPYVTTRYRQLSYRFFVIQSVAVVIYFITKHIVELVGTQNISFAYWDSVSECVMLTVYGYTLAYIYSPPPKDSHYRADALDLILSEAEVDQNGHLKPQFKLGTAHWLLYFANQAYVNVPGFPFSESSTDPCDIVSHFGFDVIEVINDPETDTHCYIARSENIVTIGFRGTASYKNAVTDVTASRAMVDDIAKEDGYSENVKIHKGFWKSYCSVRSQIIEALSKIKEDHRIKTLRSEYTNPYQSFQTSLADDDSTHSHDSDYPLIVFVTGHSLGGSLATLCAVTLRNVLNIANVRVYNFGSPRVGDHAFAAQYNSIVPHTFRICNDQDVVTTVPKFCCLYKHVGQEVLVDDRGNYIINPTFVEKVFRGRRTKVSDHFMKTYNDYLVQARDIEDRVLSFIDNAKYDPETPDNLQLHRQHDFVLPSKEEEKQKLLSDPSYQHQLFLYRQQQQQRAFNPAPVYGAQQPPPYGSFAAQGSGQMGQNGQYGQYGPPPGGQALHHGTPVSLPQGFPQPQPPVPQAEEFFDFWIEGRPLRVTTRLNTTFEDRSKEQSQAAQQQGLDSYGRRFGIDL